MPTISPQLLTLTDESLTTESFHTAYQNNNYFINLNPSISSMKILCQQKYFRLVNNNVI